MDITAPSGRLTLASGLPVTVSDVNGATIAFYTPITPGSAAPITVDGVTFNMLPFSELSNNVADATTNPSPLGPNQVVDFLLWSNAGVLTFSRSQAWASDTARANALQLVNGVLVNSQAIPNGPAAGMGTYVATCRSNAVAQLVDTAATRWCWNAYNWQRRPVKRIDMFGSFIYNTQQWQQYHNDPANQIDFVIGLVGATVLVTQTVGATYNGNAASPAIGIAVDGIFPDLYAFSLVSPNFAAETTISDAICPTTPGRHFAAAVQFGAGPTTTWYGPLNMTGDIWN